MAILTTYYALFEWASGYWIHIFSSNRGVFRLYLSCSSFTQEYVSKLINEFKIGELQLIDGYNFSLIRDVMYAIESYKKGDDSFLKEIPIELHGTEFQKTVWNELKKIPFGSVVTYKSVANRIGDKNYFRAVARACALNKIPIFIPCHRVIASNRSLGGFSGGIIWKKLLLQNEGVDLKELR